MKKSSNTIDNIKTYEPDNSLKHGYLAIFVEIARELKNNRWLTYQLFRRDFLTIYKQSFIGILWVVIIPLLSVGTFIVLSEAGVVNTGSINVPYPLYAILGMAFWQLFQTGLIATTNSLANAGGMITKINFSKKSLVIAAVGQSLIAFMIQVILVIILFLHYSIKPDMGILLLPLLMLPIVVLALGLGFILALLNGVMRDIGTVIPILLTLMMYLTPVLWAKDLSGWLAILTTYNPLNYLVSVPREFILSGHIAHPFHYAISCGLAIVIFTINLLVFHLTETRVAERV